MTLDLDEFKEKISEIEFYEPESKVMSRSGYECVAEKVGQWFLDYSDTNWKKGVLDHISSSNFKI